MVLPGVMLVALSSLSNMHGCFAHKVDEVGDGDSVWRSRAASLLTFDNCGSRSSSASSPQRHHFARDLRWP